MNYMLVHSTFLRRLWLEDVFEELTYIDYYTEDNSATVLEDQLRQMLKAESSPPRPHCPQRPPRMAHEGCFSEAVEEEEEPQLMASAHGFSYNYMVKLPPLAVLEFLKQHGYKVIGTNTIGDTCIWTLEKQTGTTEQSTPQTTAQQSTPHQTTEQMMQRMQPLL